jgi:hypothetical protein
MNAAWGGQWDMHEIIISLGSHQTTDNMAVNPEPKDKWLPENVSYNEFGGRSTSGRLQPLPMFLSKHI